MDSHLRSIPGFRLPAFEQVLAIPGIGIAACSSLGCAESHPDRIPGRDSSDDTRASKTTSGRVPW